MYSHSYNMDTSRDSGRYSPSSNSTLSRSSSFKSTSRTSLIRRNQSISAKQIRFYRNGDKYFGGLKLAVSTERYKEFDSLLAELSVKLDLASGAVRFVFNAEDGSLITDISQLQYGVAYVCCSSNTFRQLDDGYGKTSSSNWSMNRQRNVSRSTNTLTNLEGISPREAMLTLNNIRDFIKPKLVTVIKNGKPPQKKVTMLLNQKTAVSYDQVLDHLSAKGSLGKVDKLYAIDGKLVRDLRDLFDDDTVFIAFSSSEKFPEEGVELDPKRFRITPYRELKRPSNLKRSSSLRSTSGKFRDENQNMKTKGRSPRPKSMGPGAKLIDNAPKSPRGKVTGTKKMSVDVGKEELYPTAVFERESSDSGNRIDGDLRNIMLSKRDRPSIHGFYKIGKIIGDGNFAVVRECRNRKTGVDFALKVINKAKVRGKEHMIENEILILRKVKHPHIVELIEEFETAKEILLVMELVPEGDLFDAIVEATKFTEQDASHMIRDLASAVQYLHRMKIVHRDIKPENLLVVKKEDGVTSLKLADFGLSIEVKSPMFLVCGTPTYVAPEILDESGYGLEVDIWAIGVITYILLCGFPPFRSQKQDQEELFDRILRGEFEYLAPFWDDVSQDAKNLIDRLLVVNVKKRYSADDILANSWIKGHTAKTKNLQAQLSNEISKNFNHRRRLRGVALAIQTVIYLSNVIRKKAELRQTHSCIDFSTLKTDEPTRKKSSPDHKPLLTVRPSSFEESTSFDRIESPERDSPRSFPGSPVKIASLSSRIPRAKPTTPRQHIEDIRKSISNPNRYAEPKINSRNRDNNAASHRSRVEQFDMIGAAYQKVYGEKTEPDSNQRPAVTLRNRPTSAKEGSSSRRSSMSRPASSACSLPSSPKHGSANTFAPGVRKRVPLSKCVSVDDRRRKESASSMEQPASSVSRRSSASDRKPLYRASYPNRNSSYFTPALETVTAKPRLARRVSEQPDKKERIDKCSKPPAPVKKSSVVRRRTPSASSENPSVQQRDNLRKTKEAVERIAKIASVGPSVPDVTMQNTRYAKKKIEPSGAAKNEDFDPLDEGNISIVTKTNKTENIKIQHGKTVDKSIETSTTVSVTIDNDKKSTAQSSPKPFGLGRALLTKVKQLAEEIETLAMSTKPEEQEQADAESKRSFPHSSSVPVLNSGIVVDFENETVQASGSLPMDLNNSNRSQWEQDSYSETDYLSLDARSSRNVNTTSSDFDGFF